VPDAADELGVTSPEAAPAPPSGDPVQQPGDPAADVAAPPEAPAAAPPARSATAASSARAARRGAPRTYDFRRPTKLSREHVRVLQIAQENFARQATTVLTTLLRAGARMDLAGIEQFSYDDYLATLEGPVFIATFSLEPLAGKGMLA
jgi:flagellar motor switch protein FliM